jgi:hypothetical protein
MGRMGVKRTLAEHEQPRPHVTALVEGQDEWPRPSRRGTAAITSPKTPIAKVTPSRVQRPALGQNGADGNRQGEGGDRGLLTACNHILLRRPRRSQTRQLSARGASRFT